jgi:hypothetical protein
MDSFDGGRRRDPRSPLPPTERRSMRDGEPLEQRLDRWMSTGRQLVEGVSGSRPGARQGNRRSEGRPGSRGGFDGLGRWERTGGRSSGRSDRPRRQPLQAISRRGSMAAARPVETATERDVGAEQDRIRPAAAADPDRSDSGSGAAQDWPDDEVFSVPRWQRPSAPLRRPDPLQEELTQRSGRERDADGEPPSGAARPLPRSSRRR